MKTLLLFLAFPDKIPIRGPAFHFGYYVDGTVEGYPGFLNYILPFCRICAIVHSLAFVFIDDCPDSNWQVYDDTCYFTNVSQNALWPAALENCLAYGDGVNLVSINSEEENNNVASVIENSKSKEIC